MLWSTFLILVILDLCNSTAIVNSTSVNDNPRVICRDGSAVVQRAIDIHRIRSLETLRAATTDLNDPAYKAIFKSNARRQQIIVRWYAVEDFPIRAGDLGNPTFRCIYSESEAQELVPTAPYVWEYCSKPHSGGVAALGDIVFICPPFFNTQDAYPEPRPQLCPDVNNNEFVISPDGHEFPLDKSIAITTTMLFYYGAQPNTTYERPANVIELYNEILRRNNAATAPEFTSNLFFHQLVSNECRNIPNVDLPPWTNPATLNASLVGNLTSNSDSADNNTGNSTLALDDLQPLNISGSLLQGISPNALGTS